MPKRLKAILATVIAAGVLTLATTVALAHHQGLGSLPELAAISFVLALTWTFPLKTQPRLTGKSTHVIITEYDLPNRLIQPHDVVLDREGNVWYSDFGQMFLGKMDPKTGKVTQYPIPIVKPGWPEGTLDLEFDKDDNPWVGVMYQSAIAKKS